MAEAAVALVGVPAAGSGDPVKSGVVEDLLDYFPAEHPVAIALFAFVQKGAFGVVHFDVGAFGVFVGRALEAVDGENWKK